MTPHAMLALVGISVSGYTDAELDDFLAAGVTDRVEPVEQPEAHSAPPAPPVDLRAHLRRYNLEMARWRRRRA